MRLATQLSLAMLVVALFTASVIIISQTVGARRQLRSLPNDIRTELRQRPERLPRPNPTQQPMPQEARPGAVARDVFVRSLRDSSTAQRRATLLGVGLATLLATLIATYLARSISKPIERVAEAASRLAEGHRSVRVPEQTATLEVDTLTRNFNTMATSLESYERQRRAMIADIAHELRTPLAAMKLRFQALEDELLPFDKEQVQRLHRQTDLLTRLVQDLRTLSLADAGELSLQKRGTDLVKLLDTIYEGYTDKARTEEVRLEFTPDIKTLSAHVDPERVRQITGNLLDNALRVTPAGGMVTLSLAKVANEAIIAVMDTGPGISADTIEHLFDRFFQNRDSKNDHAGGSGLGLAIVKTLSELHGGSATAETTSDGAKFTVKLPLHKT